MQGRGRGNRGGRESSEFGIRKAEEGRGIGKSEFGKRGADEDGKAFEQAAKAIGHAAKK